MSKEVQNKRKILKRIALFVILFFCVLILLFGVLFLIHHFQEDESANPGNISYYPAKYDEDIFQNKAYVGFERNLLYCDGSVTQLYVFPDDLESASLECSFFLSYFDTVINGRYQELPSYYTDGYFETDPKFTMQMIYDPYVRFHSSAKEVVDNEEIEVLNFLVQYKIFKNNGTFRTGIQSNTAVPQIYQMVKVDDEYKIIRILEIEYED